MTIERVTAEPIVEVVASSSRGYDLARQRFLPLLEAPEDEEKGQVNPLSNCALTQLAYLVEPGEPHMEHLMRLCLKRCHFPAVRFGTSIAYVMELFREGLRYRADPYVVFNAHQLGLGYLDNFFDATEAHPFRELIQRLSEHEQVRSVEAA
ncbi:MAG: hypothetical protein P4L81_04440 [Candidatus Pacebacteria bacterium]|nr:hypothetical protein [Candidatus Paceibacterota bacterium]